MVFGLFGKKNERLTDALYATIMAQARQPVFYTAHRVPDTFDGRFDVLVLHVVLVLYRLKDEDVAAREQGRHLAERFFTDMDRTLREMGVGDLSVPKKMKKMADAYFGRLNAYNDALDVCGENPVLLAEALDRNLFRDHSDIDAAAAIARYAAASKDTLAATPLETVLKGDLTFPDPAGFSTEQQTS